MSRTCLGCKRLNPQEAAFCYFDGFPLNIWPGAAAEPAALNMAVRPFSIPFAFPSGAVCHNFDELALACHRDPSGALDLLRQGKLQAFLQRQGRADLAESAAAAARAPDPVCGLDDFLGELPGGILGPPGLSVQPPGINLGAMRGGEDRRLEVRLCNTGGRLLRGTASCEGCDWLALGDTPGLRRKQFQVQDEMILPVHVRGRHLRARNKPQTGQVHLESNSGTATVTITVVVPVTPFTEGVLAGSRSPRQLAEKARLSPREAAVLLESGAVDRWYQANGWTYPVQGWRASGLAAVQQFFEALGLSLPPEVDVSQESFQLFGWPGQRVERVLAVVAQEKRAVFAHGTSDQPWLEVGEPHLHGRTATLPLTVTIPLAPGRTLRANLRVITNGNRRFTIPVNLTISIPPPVRTPHGGG